MIIYSDPLYKKDAHKALRNESKIASRDVALQALFGFLTNVKAGRDRRDEEASQAEALKYYGEAVQDPSRVPQISQDLVGRARQSVSGEGLGDEGVGGFLYSKFIGGNRGLRPKDALGLLPQIQAIPEARAATELAKSRAATEGLNAATAAKNAEIAGLKYQQEVEEYADNAPMRNQARIKAALETATAQRDFEYGGREREAKLRTEEETLRGKQFDRERDAAKLPLELAKLRNEAGGDEELRKELEMNEGFLAKRDTALANRMSLRSVMTRYDPKVGISPMTSAMMMNPDYAKKLDEIGLLPNPDERAAGVKALTAVVESETLNLQREREAIKKTVDVLQARYQESVQRRFGSPPPAAVGGERPQKMIDPRGPGYELGLDEGMTLRGGGGKPVGSAGAKRTTPLNTFRSAPDKNTLVELMNSSPPDSVAGKTLRKAMESVGIRSGADLDDARIAALARALGGGR